MEINGVNGEETKTISSTLVKKGTLQEFLPLIRRGFFKIEIDSCLKHFLFRKKTIWQRSHDAMFISGISSSFFIDFLNTVPMSFPPNIPRHYPGYIYNYQTGGYDPDPTYAARPAPSNTYSSPVAASHQSSPYGASTQPLWSLPASTPAPASASARGVNPFNRPNAGWQQRQALNQQMAGAEIPRYNTSFQGGYPATPQAIGNSLARPTTAFQDPRLIGASLPRSTSAAPRPSFHRRSSADQEIASQQYSFSTRSTSFSSNTVVEEEEEDSVPPSPTFTRNRRRSSRLSAASIEAVKAVFETSTTSSAPQPTKLTDFLMHPLTYGQDNKLYVTQVTRQGLESYMSGALQLVANPEDAMPEIYKNMYREAKRLGLTDYHVSNRSYEDNYREGRDMTYVECTGNDYSGFRTADDTPRPKSPLPSNDEMLPPNGGRYEAGHQASFALTGKAGTTVNEPTQANQVIIPFHDRRVMEYKGNFMIRLDTYHHTEIFSARQLSTGNWGVTYTIHRRRLGGGSPPSLTPDSTAVGQEADGRPRRTSAEKNPYGSSNPFRQRGKVNKPSGSSGRKPPTWW